MDRSVSTKEAPGTGAAAETVSERRRGRLLPLPSGDIRSGRPYLLSEGQLRSFVRRLASVGALVFLDLLGLTLGLYAAFTLRELIRGNTPILWGVLWDAEADFLPFLALITVLVFWQGGLYSPREYRSGFGRILSSLVLVAALTIAFGLGTGHRFSTFGIFPTALVLTASLIALFRASYESLTGWLLRASGVRRRAVLVGEGDHLAHLYDTLGSDRGGIDYEFLGAVATAPDGLPLRHLGGLGRLPLILEEFDVDELIVTESDLSEQELFEVVEEAHRQAVKVRVAPKTTKLLVQRGEYVPGQGMPLFELRPPVFAGTDWAVKRGFDLIASAAIIVFGLPLWIGIALAIKLSSRGPVLYRDRRIGLHEREFGMIKFRTMYADAADRQAELEHRNEADGPLFKIEQDPRVTPVGAVLRRFSLDEIPNVLNVLRGEMSLVGPRPLPIRDNEQLEVWHRKRYLVLPGMTGLWQISGRSSLSFDDLVRLDFYYLDNWSIWLDITILAKTIPAVLARRGAY
jgi:exopolysaccharide biosynthesis polyprenyl glycosylphosphotransferase